jgi:sigma-B regulation protein RsbU (phosphoserine phosphatase)
VAGSGDAFGELYEGAACGLLVTSTDGLIERANRTFCGWIGREAIELVGKKKIQDLLTMGGRIFHQTHWAPLLQIQGSVSEVKLELLHADGRRIPIVWNAVRRERDGRAWHELAVFVAEDRHKYEQELVVARRRAEDLLMKEQEAQASLRAAQMERDRQQALAQDRALFAEQMVAIVSHDLRNPLTVVRMSTLLLARGELSDRQRGALQRLSKSNERALRLISDLLDFSSGRLGKGLRFDLKTIDLHGLVNDSIEDLRLAFPDRDIRHRSVGTGPCHGSADRLLQLIVNLASNALVYGAVDRPVLIGSTIAEDEFSIAVHNEGQPIADDLLPNLFDPMTRGSASVDQLRSVGLGLYIVREIAHAHGGEIAVTSSAESGTTFTATFPRAESNAPDGEESAWSEREAVRQAALDSLRIDSSEETAFDDIVRLAAETFDVPIALISLIDGDRQWFKARVGLQARETPRAHAFCAHAIEVQDKVLVVEDATSDPRFATNPLVTGDPNIRFYAGAPLVTRSGAALGTVCIIDTKPRTADRKQLETLQFLAQQVVHRLEERARGDETEP